ncbi:MAG: poly-gamma-glutamate synthase PgsB [Acidobacteriota bacterium]
MSSFAVLSGVVGLLLALAVVEFRRHQRSIAAIPHRIHVNGTRGKSSVTRLIGAGLRAGGIRTVTKVTGTFPRLILEDGSDVPVHRKAAASILEQLGIMRFAVDRGAEALVIECMALQPDYQRLTEEQMVHATVSVLTNVRLDHTDVMGRTLPEIAASMGNTIPANGTVFTSEADNPRLIAELAAAKGTVCELVTAEQVAAEALDGFGYIEHRDNVALALAVCRHLGVDDETALAGMWRAVPDAGVLTRSRVEQGGKVATLFNAFAANDPDSSARIWSMLRDGGHLRGQRFVLLNSRPDRKDRSEQLAHLVADELGEECDRALVMGEPTDAVVRLLRGYGFAGERTVDLGKAMPERVLEAIFAVTESESSIVAIGNMGGQGAATVALFEERSRTPHG